MEAQSCGRGNVPPGAKCHVIDYSSEHADVAAFVPHEGLIILRAGRVIGWCDINDDTVSSISIFWTYQPLLKHYVLQLASKVVVVPDTTPLTVSHTFDNVVKFEIRDFNNVGYAQLGLWKDCSDTPHITDLTASSSLPSSNPVETVLRAKLRGLKLSVSKVQKQLDEKRQLRKQCVFHLFGNSTIKKEHGVGKTTTSNIRSPGVSETKSDLEFVAVLKSWQRLLNKSWILGCDLENNSSKPLKSISLCVSDFAGLVGQKRPCVQWRVMVRRSYATALGLASDAPWTVLPPDGVLEAGQRAAIVATVPEPAFRGCSHVTEIRGAVNAILPDGRVVWANLPAWRLSVDEVLRGVLVPFRPQAMQAPHEDLLACLACSPVRVRLRLEGRPGLPDRVARVLSEAWLRPPGVPVDPQRDTPGATTLQGTSTLLVGCGAPETPLLGAMAVLHVLASTACTLRLHLRDVRHVFLVLHSLLAGLPPHTRVTNADAPDDADADPSALGRELERALEAELDALSALRPVAEADEDRGGRLTRRELHCLEMATDLAAQKLRLASV